MQNPVLMKNAGVLQGRDGKERVQYYDDLIDRHPDWVLYRRYIDEGITGTSISGRKTALSGS